ncbi:MAG: FAD-dependent oxidoreductase [Planctomycetes bacterium]|nr:FAD-dependent oxidoreductase [Planctomycetota bacterium]
MSTRVRIDVDGRSIEVDADASLAAALITANVATTRTSVRGEPRGPLCGMGVCFECRATVDDFPHVRTCMTRVRAGMRVRTGAPAAAPLTAAAPPLARLDADVVVVGAGPAGLAAACAAAQGGKRVLILDDNDGTGGQIWRRDAATPAATWRARAQRLGVLVESSTRVVGVHDERSLLAVRGDAARVVGYGALVLATGSTERFVTFPGWTLPRVFGAGGAHALLKSGLRVDGSRVVVAGSGPLLLAVAATWARHGARVVALVEQAPAARVRAFARGLWARPAKLAQAAWLRARLLGVPFRMGWWPQRIDSAADALRVTITDGRRVAALATDYVACGFGLVPDVRLAAVLGCAIERGAVVVDDEQRTSVPHVFCAGETTGIGGVDKALLEGERAGSAAAGVRSTTSRAMLARERRFAAALETTFALRDELRALTAPDTIVCRCEDVLRSDVDACASWRDAKLQTRIGMGPCQGRVCGSGVAFTHGFAVADARPPVFNVPLSTLCGGPDSGA